MIKISAEDPLANKPDVARLDAIMDEFQVDQPDEIYIAVILGGLANPEFAAGFACCYGIIKTAMKRQEVAELAGLYKASGEGAVQ